MTPRHGDWRTSSYTGTNGNCVEIARTESGGALIRDTKDRPGGHLTLTPIAWHAFLTTLKTPTP